MAPQAIWRLEVLILADEAMRRRLYADLDLFTRRVTAVAEPHQLLGQVWELGPEVIIVQGRTLAANLPALCLQIRQFFQTPILIVEDGASESDRISWLDSGADDVLALASATPAELSARCNALLRRLRRQLRRDPTSLRMHALDMQLDIAGRRLYPADGQPVDLSAGMTRLLALFFSYGDGLVPTEALDHHLFGTSTPTTRERSSALLQSLNRRLAELPEPYPRIERVRGSGYRLTNLHRTLPDPDPPGQSA